MLFYMYLASVVVSAVITHITQVSFLEKLKHDRIQVIGKVTWGKELSTLIFTFFKICLPIYNLLYILYELCCYESIYEKMVTRLFLKGKAIFDEVGLDRYLF